MFSFWFSQYFETDDQEFYKTKVCFILNNDVSEMDLVFAEEKYSKSGQLEKVRQHFGKELLFFILIADVISQAMGATIQTKETILLFGMNHNGALFFPWKSVSAAFIPARSVMIWTMEWFYFYRFASIRHQDGLEVELQWGWSLTFCFWFVTRKHNVYHGLKNICTS